MCVYIERRGKRESVCVLAWPSALIENLSSVYFLLMIVSIKVLTESRYLIPGYLNRGVFIGLA